MVALFVHVLIKSPVSPLPCGARSNDRDDDLYLTAKVLSDGCKFQDKKHLMYIIRKCKIYLYSIRNKRKPRRSLASRPLSKAYTNTFFLTMYIYCIYTRK